MTDSELLPIGLFAQRSGLTASALRFYADSGLLPPAETDAVSGYRYYSPDQLERAVTLRRLRAIAMPLTAVETVLAAGADEAVRLIDEHVAKVADDAARARRTAADIKAGLLPEQARFLATLKGPVLAAAIEQVLTATAFDAEFPVLGGLLLEVTPEAVTLTATDRYRLATRTLAPVEPANATWSATVDGGELRAAIPEIRRGTVVHLEANQHGLALFPQDREVRHCRLLPESFPDFRAMLRALPAVGTRVTIAKDVLLRALEEHPGDRILLRLKGDELRVIASPDAAGPALPITSTGPDLDVRFEMITLYPAISTALGPDLMIELRGPDQPATIRSADHGDLTTLAMPTA